MSCSLPSDLHEDLADLIQRMKRKEGLYFDKRLTVPKLARRLHANRAIAVYNRGRISSFGAFWRATQRSSERVYELGSMCWGKGQLPELVCQLMRIAPPNDTFLITRSDEVMEVVAEHGFQPVTRQIYRGSEWARAVGLTDKLGIEDRLPKETVALDRFEPNGQRWMLFKEAV